MACFINCYVGKLPFIETCFSFEAFKRGRRNMSIVRLSFDSRFHNSSKHQSIAAKNTDTVACHAVLIKYSDVCCYTGSRFRPLQDRDLPEKGSHNASAHLSLFRKPQVPLQSEYNTRVDVDPFPCLCKSRAVIEYFYFSDQWYNLDTWSEI